MLEKKDGISDLQTMDGYWVGEVGFVKSQEAQGYRYKMKPTSKELKEGMECRPLIQIGPFKIRDEFLGGTGNNPKLRALKKKIAAAGQDDPGKIEANKYWKQKYECKRYR